MSESTEEFDQLRKLLTLKRYEQPSPRFFNEFSGNVIAGIRAQKAAPAVVAWWEHVPGVAWLFRAMEANSMIAGGVATTICSLLIGVIAWSEFTDQPVPSSAFSNVTGIPSPQGNQAMLLTSGSSGMETMLAGTNDYLLHGSPFDNYGSLSVQSVSFKTSQ